MPARFVTRIDGWSRRASAAMLALFAALVLVSAIMPSRPVETLSQAGSARMTDPQLYQGVIDGVSRGEDYYTVAAREHHAGHFPLKPFVTVRPPTLALLSAALGPTGTRVLLFALILATLLAWFRRLRGEVEGPARIALLGLVAASTFLLTIPVLSLFHETWAGLLLALSLALRKPGRVASSIAFALAAVLIRETALPYLLLMMTLALWERRWREAAGWATACAVFLSLLAVHAAHVQAITLPGDLTSPGWSGMAGWPLYVSAMATATPLALLPDWVAKLLIPLALFGWAAWASDLALRVTGLLLGFGLMIILFARPDTFYWGLLMTPLLLGGLAFAPSAIDTLFRQARA